MIGERVYLCSLSYSKPCSLYLVGYCNLKKKFLVESKKDFYYDYLHLDGATDLQIEDNIVWTVGEDGRVFLMQLNI